MNNPFGLISQKAGPVPLTGLKVEADILGRGARVQVCQKFRNREENPVEAVYKFPLPEGAAICGFHVRIDGKVIRGRVEEREKAFEIYDEALARGDGGYLLDEDRPNVFTLSVGNLNPGSEAVVQIDYITLLDMEGEKVRFFLPTTISPRYIPNHIEDEEGIPQEEKPHPPFAVDVPYGLSILVNIHNGESLKSIASPSHSIQVDLQQDPVRVSFAGETIRMDRDFILHIQRVEDVTASKAYCIREGKDTFVQLDLSLQDQARLGDPGEESPKESFTREVNFVLDCSGSMEGDSIIEAKKALEIFLRGMEKGTRFNIYRFGSNFESVFEEPAEYTERSLGEAIAYLRRIDADLGGTEIYAPLMHVYSAGPVVEGSQRTIILLTDGEVGNEEQIIKLVREHRNSTRFLSLGIGAGPNEYFIKGLARAGMGAWEFIYPGERIEPKVLRMFKKLKDQVLERPEIQWGIDAVEQAPVTPLLFIDNPTTVFARIRNKGKPEKKITVQGALKGETHRWEIDLLELGKEEFPIAVHWARERIRDMEEGEGLDQGKGSRQRRKKDEKWRKTVIELSKAYNLLSGSTSYVAVEEREERDKTTGELVLRKVPVPVTVGWHGIGSAMGIRHFATSPDTFSNNVCSDVELYSPMAPPLLMRRFPGKRSISKMSVSSEQSSGSRNHIDSLMTILALQRAEGGIDLDEEVGTLLGLDLDELRREAKNMEVEGTVDRLLLLWTAIILEVLEIFFPTERATWAGVVKKSQDWLSKNIRAGKPRISGMDLMEWVAGRVRDMTVL